MADEKTTKHTCNDGRGPVFGRKTPNCPRCDELANGAAPVKWTWTSRRDDDARRAAEIRNHNCRTSGCSVICTFGDW
ncbi:hypothetical protein ACIBSV_23490 [Embleya sp. NPDC050154]|uniref:hypothetical protein n=1 Tax=Embleya sp. NPDC050154 TaxID=3363988 RepID=UPI0037B9E01C